VGHEGVGVLIVDDQKVVRDGLALILGMIDGVTVLGTAVDGADAVRQVQLLAPEVVLMDLHMPVMDGVQATEVLRREAPGSKVVVLTTYADDEWVFGALKAGALGFLTKDAGADEIRSALLTVAAGRAQLDPGVQLRLLEALTRGEQACVAEAGGRGSGGGSGVPDGLTPREVDVLALVAQGLSNTEIAGQLFVSDSTVKTHINHLLAKTGMRDRAQLVGYAFRHQLTAQP
jgi:DNA-binding NarL/FixJ family response regulator